ncbi:MAG: DUF1559 domain-containing protein [Candidatus Hydrogenedentes bacterium]|nr:DUF1559 domain-containing protein [Candidatus Hydrogenedentota bacterium]
MKVSGKEFAFILAALIVLSILVVPALSRARETGKRATCQNNLKQLGIVLKMYANESRGECYPPLSPKSGNWMMDMDAVYPEYLSDLTVLKCPDSPLNFDQDFTLRENMRHPGAPLNVPHPDCVTGKYYTYTGYTLTGDETALALYFAYHANPDAVRKKGDLTLPIPHWEHSQWNAMKGGFVVLWDRVPADPAMMPHKAGAINVLAADGSVQAVRYSPMNQSENFPATEIAALTFGLDVPETDPGCY